MKKIALFLLFALSLTACKSVGQPSPTVDQQPAKLVDYAEVLDRACPVVRGTLMTLAVTDGVSDKTRETIKDIRPIVEAACLASQGGSAGGVRELANKAIPPLMEAINDSDLTDNQKQAALVGLVAAQVVLAGVM